LAADLAALGHPLPAPALPLPHFSPAPGTALGTAWVLAGSALGNRAIAKQVARIGGGAWPVAFLGDGAMMAFWQRLRTRIERPAAPSEAEGAADAAAAVFAHFLAVAERAGAAPESVPA
jgi:heme oxygenase